MIVFTSFNVNQAFRSMRWYARDPGELSTGAGRLCQAACDALGSDMLCHSIRVEVLGEGGYIDCCYEISLSR